MSTEYVSEYRADRGVWVLKRVEGAQTRRRPDTTPRPADVLRFPDTPACRS